MAALPPDRRRRSRMYRCPRGPRQSHGTARSRLAVLLRWRSSSPHPSIPRCGRRPRPSARPPGGGPPVRPPSHPRTPQPAAVPCPRPSRLLCQTLEQSVPGATDNNRERMTGQRALRGFSSARGAGRSLPPVPQRCVSPRSITGRAAPGVAYWDAVAALNTPVVLDGWPGFDANGRPLDADAVTRRRHAFLPATLDALESE